MQIQSVRKLEARHCTFVTFVERSSAEKAAEGLAGRLYIQGQRCRLLWGRPQAERTAPSTSMLPPQARLKSTWLQPERVPPSITDLPGIDVWTDDGGDSH